MRKIESDLNYECGCGQQVVIGQEIRVCDCGEKLCCGCFDFEDDICCEECLSDTEADFTKSIEEIELKLSQIPISESDTMQYYVYYKEDMKFLLKAYRILNKRFIDDER